MAIAVAFLSSRLATSVPQLKLLRTACSRASVAALALLVGDIVKKTMAKMQAYLLIIAFPMATNCAASLAQQAKL